MTGPVSPRARQIQGSDPQSHTSSSDRPNLAKEMIDSLEVKLPKIETLIKSFVRDRACDLQSQKSRM
jgi:hypothetical protein